jgi:hypothetical protein
MVVALVGGAIGAIAAALISGGCFTVLGADRARPYPGSPRAGCCRRFASEWRWVALIGGGALVMSALSLCLSGLQLPPSPLSRL